MHKLRTGLLSSVALPVWDAPKDQGGGGADNGGNPNPPPEGADTQSQQKPAEEGGQNGSAAFDPAKAYSALDPDTRKWLDTKDFANDPSKLAKSAHELEKMLGSSIRVPGKDATAEERDAFLNKLGRPEKPDGYQFTPPKDLPEGLPYDATRANKLKTDLHTLGLTQSQAAAIHDMYVSEVTGMHAQTQQQSAAQIEARATTATEALEKEWGPIDGERARANFEMADRVFTSVPGGQDFLAELTSLGMVGPNKEVLSVPLAKMLSSLGGAIFAEDNVLRGKRDIVNNPFADGEHNNLTMQMKLVKEDPDQARSFIAAAGKKPEDFGLKA